MMDTSAEAGSEVQKHLELAVTAIDTEKAQAVQDVQDHWSLFLHCTICFGFFHNPHTLECGHSFCKRCLKRLAEIARDDNPDVRLRRLSLNCPTCRHPFPAKPVFLGRVRTCIVLKHLVDLWKQECKKLLSTPSRQLRSICSQTETDNGQTSIPRNLNLHEEFSTSLLHGDEYFGALMKRVAEATEDIDLDQADDAVSKTRLRRDQSSSDSESSVSSFGDDATNGGGNNGEGSANASRAGGDRSLSNVSIPDIFGRLSASRVILTSSESFPARLLLIGIWFIYSLLIVALAEAFLPHVILFTLFFFLIVLK